jgi:hypothetical protein
MEHPERGRRGRVVYQGEQKMLQYRVFMLSLADEAKDPMPR